MGVYVDDIIITGSNSVHIQQIKDHLNQVFSIKDLGKLHYFLGIEIAYTNAGIVLSQKKFTKDLLQCCPDTLKHKDVTPLPLNVKLSQSGGSTFSKPEYST